MSRGELSLERRMRAIEDQRSIRDLKATYLRGVDDRQWEVLRALFTDDCVFSSSAPMPPVDGPDEFIDFVRRLIVPGRSTHLGFLPTIDVVSEVQAAGSWSMFDRVELDAPGRRGWEGFGRYLETYRRGSGGSWQISSWRLERTMIRTLSI